MTHADALKIASEIHAVGVEIFCLVIVLGVPLAALAVAHLRRKPKVEVEIPAAVWTKVDFQGHRYYLQTWTQSRDEGRGTLQLDLVDRLPPRRR